MLVCWLPKTANTIPANASHRVGVGAFVMKSKRGGMSFRLISGFPLPLHQGRGTDLGIVVLLLFSQQLIYIYIYIYI